MKIIFVEKNSLFRLIPDSALLLKNRPLFCPDHAQTLHAKIALVVKINRLGKHIQEKFAPTYYNEIGVAINFYNKNCLDTLTQEGLPWERATCFDGSFALSEFMKIPENANLSETSFSKNNNETQPFKIESTLQKIPHLISELSTFMTLKIGDYIAFELGEPTSAPLVINDVLRVYLGDEEMVRVVLK